MGKWLYGGVDGPVYVMGPGEHIDGAINWAPPIPVTATETYTLSPEPKPTPVDAHAQMLAARVEGLEKELNGLQHVWGRVKALETEVARLRMPAAMPEPSLGHIRLLLRAVEELPTNSPAAHDIVAYLRNR
jgi:hypothetical protein